MRKIAFALALGTGVSAPLFFLNGVATADPYKWCAQTTIAGGSSNCGFVTFEQCQAAISGLGGICQQNPFYTGPNSQPTTGGGYRTRRLF